HRRNYRGPVILRKTAKRPPSGPSRDKEAWQKVFVILLVHPTLESLTLRLIPSPSGSFSALRASGIGGYIALSTKKGAYIRFIPVVIISVARIALNTISARYLALVEVVVVVVFILDYSTSKLSKRGLRDASLNMPRSILGSYLISAISSFVIVITYCFYYRLYLDLVSFTSFPFIEIYARATGSNARTVGLIVIITMLSFFSRINTIASASRQTFAFARDGGLPFYKALSKVSPRFYSLAYLAVFEIAVGTLIFRRLWGPPLPKRRWSLGRAGLPINIFAFAHGLFAAAIMAMPTDPFKGHCPPHGCTVRNWNWGTVIFAGILLMAMAYYLLGGRKRYAGPVTLVSDEGGWKTVRTLHVWHSTTTAG
ncbi:Amino acid permease, partial [Teratosphaeria destructans]